MSVNTIFVVDVLWHRVNVWWNIVFGEGVLHENIALKLCIHFYLPIIALSLTATTCEHEKGTRSYYNAMKVIIQFCIWTQLNKLVVCRTPFSIASIISFYLKALYRKRSPQGLPSSDEARCCCRECFFLFVNHCDRELQWNYCSPAK